MEGLLDSQNFLDIILEINIILENTVSNSFELNVIKTYLVKTKDLFFQTEKKSFIPGYHLIHFN